jgi:hypothetical protein
MSKTFETIAKAFRHNTGASFLDSGSAYGRHHEKPPISNNDPAISIYCYTNEVMPTIEVAHFLAEQTEVDFDIQSQFDEWVTRDENSELSWFEAGEQFATEVLGLTQRARDNTYNGENDLSQDYVWEIYSNNENNDWIYDDDALLVIYAHTGCDVRGGYAYPLFLRSTTDYSIPVDLTAQFFAAEGRLNGVNLEQDELRELDEQWQCGYSSCPSYEFNKNVDRIFTFTKTTDSVVVKIKSGEIVKVVASLPYF